MKKVIICAMAIMLLFGTIGCTLNGKDSSGEANESISSEKVTSEESVATKEHLSGTYIPKTATEETTEKHLFNINENNVSIINVNVYGTDKKISDKKELSKIIKDINNFTYNIIGKESRNTIQNKYGGPAMTVQVFDKQNNSICSFSPTDQNGKYTILKADTHYIHYYTPKEYIIDYDYFGKYIWEPTTEKSLYNINKNDVSTIYVNGYFDEVKVTDKKRISEIISGINNFKYNKVEKQERPNKTDAELRKGNTGVGSTVVRILDKQGREICFFYPAYSSITIVTDTNMISYKSTDREGTLFTYFRELIIKNSKNEEHKSK